MNQKILLAGEKMDDGNEKTTVSDVIISELEKWNLYLVFREHLLLGLLMP